MIMTLNDKLNALKIPGFVEKITENDFYINYQIEFEPQVTLSRIKARLDDLTSFFGSQVELDTTSGTVLKVQKGSRSVIPVNDFIRHLPKDPHGVPLIIGLKENGDRIYYDLTKCPHILAGGSTGSGKSVFMHNLIISTLYAANTNIIMIDVKRVEFSIYEGIPHLMTPIIYDSITALDTLKKLCHEMEKRYNTLKAAKCRNIQEYRKSGHKMNFIAVFIDELADLLMTEKEIETYLVKIAQLGRAAGIHLITATQRPDASILSGLIRANIPTRVCFAVQKATDSRIILDSSGGEKLKGAGDGLFCPIGLKNPVRFQSPYMDTSELEKIAERARHVND